MLTTSLKHSFGHFPLLDFCYLVERQCFAVDDFRCTTTGACIRSYKVCDGTVDCSDRSDEESCCKKL